MCYHVNVQSSSLHMVSGHCVDLLFHTCSTQPAFLRVTRILTGGNIYPFDFDKGKKSTPRKSQCFVYGTSKQSQVNDQKLCIIYAKAIFSEREKHNTTAESMVSISHSFSYCTDRQEIIRERMHTVNRCEFSR